MGDVKEAGAGGFEVNGEGACPVESDGSDAEYVLGLLCLHAAEETKDGPSSVR